MKILILFSFIFIISYQAHSQDIENTLGTNGKFVVKDGSVAFLILNQSDGLFNIKQNIRLENIQGYQIGSIYKGVDRFLHTYAPSGVDGYNTFLGINAGNFTMSGIYVESSNNTGIGHSSLFSNTTGFCNTAIGNSSLRFNTTGSSNTAIGYQSLYSNTEGYINIAVGHNSLYNNTTGIYNTAVGHYSLSANTIGEYNTAIGNSSLRFNTTGIYNIAMGYQSLYSNTEGDNNTAVGINSLYSNTEGYYNTAVGLNAGYSLTTGYNNIIIGYYAEASSVGAHDEITLGNSQIGTLRCATTTITSLSDARDKKNINDLSLGLDFITRLKPRQFNWDRREWYEDSKSDGSKMEEKLTAGFIAQELDEVQQSENAEWLELVYTSNPEKLEATTGNLLPVMVKAIQELNDKNESLEEEIAQLKNEIESLNTVNEKLVKLEKLIIEMKSNENEIKEIKQ